MSRIRKRLRQSRPELSEPQILAWADAHHTRTGQWPRSDSGFVREQLGDSWRKIDSALRYGLRGLTGGASLARLLAQRRGVRNLRDLPPLTIRQILAWSDGYRSRTGHWPTSESGPIAEAPGETWRAVDQALRVGIRGVAGSSSLARLLAAQRHARNLCRLPRLTLRRILTWADGHRRRTGCWPTSRSGPVREAPGETWGAIAIALQRGRRGLPVGGSLARLLAARRDVRTLYETTTDYLPGLSSVEKKARLARIRSEFDNLKSSNVSLGKPDGFPLLIKGAVLFQRVRSGTCGFYRSAAP
jgi:hypothetical protein